MAVGTSCSAGTWRNATTAGESPPGSGTGPACLSLGRLGPSSSRAFGSYSLSAPSLSPATPKPFCRRSPCGSARDPWEAALRLLAPSTGLTFSSSSAHPQLGQDLICWPRTGGGACRGEFANLLLNHSALCANVRLFGAKEVTYLGSARQLGVVVQGEVGLWAGVSSRGRIASSPRSASAAASFTALTLHVPEGEKTFWI